MATSSFRCALLLLFAACGAQGREASSEAECARAALNPPISEARAAASGAPQDLRAQFRLADAWSEAGCFSDAQQVLSEAAKRDPGNRELQTRLRVARSVVGEEHFFDNLDRAEDQARLKRIAFRCSNLQDVDACSELVKTAPNDAPALVQQGDALLKAGRGAEAGAAYRHAASLAPGQLQLDQKIAAAGALVAPASAEAAAAPAVTAAPASASRSRTGTRLARSESAAVRFSNLEPDNRSH